MEIQPHQQRMLDERDELGVKMKGLYAFIGSERFNALSSDDQNLMRMQQMAMLQYHAILHQRIIKFAP